MKTAHVTMAALTSTLFLAGALASGCGDEATTGDEDNIVPADAQTPFDQAAVCDQTLQRHVSVKEGDLKEGTLRWGCGDVKGVDGADRGQEYCEYAALSAGKRVEAIADHEAGQPLYCYFTSVYYDVDGNGGSVGARDAELAQALSQPENFGTTIAPELVRMKKQFNSRGAATTLIEDCEKIKPDLNEQRQVACYQASLKGKGEELKKLCRGQDLADDARWAKAEKLGAKLFAEGEEGYEYQQDIIGCLSVGRAAHGGLAFRNSDPMICGRVYRAQNECQCSWSALPAALEGFLFTGWTADEPPVGCRRAVVDGQDYAHVIICEVPAGEAEEIELNLDYAENLPAFCNDRFGKDIVMKAPLRAVEDAGSCQPNNDFCTAFIGEPAQTGTGTGTETGTDTGTGTGTGTTCAHDECTAGAALEASCSPCAQAMCAADPYCCSDSWDETCVQAVPSVCGTTCP